MSSTPFSGGTPQEMLKLTRKLKGSRYGDAKKITYLDMISKHRILCVDHSEHQCHGHHASHIVGIGTGHTPGQIDQRWSLEEVLAAMHRGEVFYTQGEHTHKIAEVESYHCTQCGGTHIRTQPDHAHDNNLNALASCPIVPACRPTRDRDDRKPQPNRQHA